MNDEQLTQVLHAIIGRLSPGDARRIADAADEAWHAGMHLGTSSQVKAHQNQGDVIKAAVSRINEHDRNLIADAIKEAAREGMGPPGESDEGGDTNKVNVMENSL